MAKKYRLEIDLGIDPARERARQFLAVLGQVDRAAAQLAGTVDRSAAGAARAAPAQAEQVRRVAAAHQQVAREAQAAGKAVERGAAVGAARVQVLATELGRTQVAMAALDRASARFGRTVATVGAGAKVTFRDLEREMDRAARSASASAARIQAAALTSKSALIGAIQQRMDDASARRVANVGFAGPSAASGPAFGLLEPPGHGMGDLERRRQQIMGGMQRRTAMHGQAGFYMPPLPAPHEGQVVSMEAMYASAQRAKSEHVDRQLKQEERYRAGFTKAVTDRELAQTVANEKMRRSNDARVEAALKGAGLEEESHSRILSSLGMMVLRFAAYHLVIGKSIQLMNAYADATKRAREEQDRLINKAVDEADRLRALAAQLGVKPDAAFTAQVAAIGARTGAGPEGAAQALNAAAESGAQFIGRTLTHEQFMEVNERAIAFARQRGIDQAAMGRLVGEGVGDRDIRGKGAAGSAEAFARIAGPFLALQRGKGPPAVLGEQLAEFHAGYHSQFKEPLDEAIFLSQIAEGKPRGNVMAAGRALMEQLASPSAKLQPLLRRVMIDKDGRQVPLMRGEHMTGEYTGQEMIAAIQADFNRRNLTEAQRSAEVSKHFTVKTGLAAARGVFGLGAAGVEAERRAFVAREGTPEALEAARQAAAGGVVEQVARGKAAVSEEETRLGLESVEIVPELLAAEKRLAPGNLDPMRQFGRAIKGWFGFPDEDKVRQRLEAQRSLMAEIEQLGGARRVLVPGTEPGDIAEEFRLTGPGRTGKEVYAPFGGFMPDTHGETDPRLRFLVRERDRLRAARRADPNAGAAGPAGWGADPNAGAAGPAGWGADPNAGAGGSWDGPGDQANATGRTELMTALVALTKALERNTVATLGDAGRGAPGVVAVAPPPLPFGLVVGPLRG